MNPTIAQALADARALRDRKALMERGFTAAEAVALVALQGQQAAGPADADGAKYAERDARVREIVSTVRVIEGRPVQLTPAEAQRVAFYRWLAQQRDAELTKGDS